MKTIKTLIYLLVSISFTSNAQTKLQKTAQTIKTSKEVSLNLNTNNCTIELDTWNKESIEIEAFVEGEKLSKQELEEALKNWKLTIDATTDEVTITAKNKDITTWHNNAIINDPETNVVIIEELKHELADLPEIHIEEIHELPALPEQLELPVLPELPELPEGVDSFSFNYNSYKKEGDAYIEEWSKQFEKKFGKDFAKKMEQWAEKFEKEWKNKQEAKIKIIKDRVEKRNNLLEKRIEAEQKRHHDRIIHLEKRKLHEKERNELASKRRIKIERILNTNTSKTKRIIKIKLPKKSKINANIRHGELKLASVINNIDANLAYTKLVANGINGEKTSINASYAPLHINQWTNGKLTLNYVTNASLDSVNNLVLTSNSSSTIINSLTNSAIVNDSFGQLEILNLNSSFNNLNLITQNGKAIIKLPKTNFNLLYNGKHSVLKHPKNSKAEKVSTYNIGTTMSPKKIILNGVYSSIFLK